MEALQLALQVKKKFPVLQPNCQILEGIIIITIQSSVNNFKDFISIYRTALITKDVVR